ncbi:MAG: DsbA family protein [Pseudorhodobacter sp.]
MRHTIIGLAALLLSTTALHAEMTAAERETFRAEVRAYLMDNPEVLMEAIGVLEDRRMSEAAANDVALLATNADEIFNDPASWSGGNPDGDVTVVEFIDYRCGYCRRAHDDVTELVGTDGNIRLVMKEFPILGEQSDLSSRFAISVLQLEGAEAYKTVHDALITYRGDVTPEALAGIGTEAGLSDVAAVLAHMASAEVTSVIEANHALGQRLGINGTPTFVIDGTMVRGYVPLDGMRQIVEGQREG